MHYFSDRVLAAAERDELPEQHFFVQDNLRRCVDACLFTCTQIRSLFAQRLPVVKPANLENEYLLLIKVAPATKWQRLSGRKQIEVRIHGDAFLHLAAMTCAVQDIIASSLSATWERPPR